MALSVSAQTVPATSNQQDAQGLTDYIVAIVQHQPITHTQLKARVLSLQQTYAPDQQPSEKKLEQLALSQLITQSALAQRAQEYGLSIDQKTIMQAAATIASNNNVTLDELRKKMAESGVPFSSVLQNIENQMLIGQLRERTLDRTIFVSNAEIDEFLEKNMKATNPTDRIMSLAQVLIAVPENISEQEERKYKARADEVYQKMSKAMEVDDFLAIVDQYSDDPMKAQTGGAMGEMPVSRYPDLFVDAVQGLKSGDVTKPVRSGAGYHVILVIGKEQSEMVVTQTHARHILIEITEKRTEAEAVEMLQTSKRKIQTEQVSFETLAQEQSQDSSARVGGDLGWVVPGMFVPEFEAVMDRLKPDEISDPVVTRFGVHLIQVLERRESELTSAQQREIAKETVHQRKVEEGYEQWAKEIEAETYIEIRAPANK